MICRVFSEGAVTCRKMCKNCYEKLCEGDFNLRSDDRGPGKGQEFQYEELQCLEPHQNSDQTERKRAMRLKVVFPSVLLHSMGHKSGEILFFPESKKLICTPNSNTGNRYDVKVARIRRIRRHECSDTYTI